MNLNEEPIIEYMKVRTDAVAPVKVYENDDVGWDLVAVAVHKVISPSVTLYDTGLVIKPPDGYYTEIRPRSSISKTDYVISNSPGTIERGFRGSLLISMRKVSDDYPPLELPFKLAQLTLHKREGAKMKEVFEMDDTERGTGGFGSTDGKTK